MASFLTGKPGICLLHYPGACFTRQGPLDVCRVRDQSFLAPVLEVADDGLYFRSHTPFGKLPFLQKPPGFVEGEPVQQFLIGLVEVEGDLLDGSR